MSDLKQAKTLLLAGHRDLRALKGMLNQEVFADEIFGFHIQQAAEKAIKAWLAAIGDVFPYTHDLGTLLQRLEARGYDVSEFWELLEFTPYALQFR
ncbi:HEPN domain-containing protein [Nodosilinea sp. PGN35]|uniref:HEPN domain-containing protein n=1 Tax=Nodosilinea sp. PGN35 TaxID=3020489 RepID=UPI0023B22389|nr:HEPN domain-containing protein [Nodosilinea sp. TSF1-S3]MDF0369169.1 HEPN domain-containing protein [Nodosilinea sp. TSF1-S3]